MRALRRLAVLGLAVLLFVATVATRAQEPAGCPDLVARALALTSERCLDLGRDEVCYGNVKLTLDPREGVDQAAIQFSQPGDRIGLASVSSLTLGPLDQASDEWGVAYIRMRANLPDVAGGQFVTMLMFGDTEIRDASEELSRVSGKDYAPMQAFYFRTGVGGGGQSGALDACRGLPTDGVLIQTPKGAGEIQLVANEVNLTLGSTVLLEAPGEPETLGNLQTPTGFQQENFDPPEMTITTFEGQAGVEALGQTQLAGPGQQVTVPLDQDSRPFGPPQAPQYTDPTQYNGLTDLITGAGEEQLIDLREADPTATLQPSATPTPTAIPPTRVPVTATPTATVPPTLPPPPAPTAAPTSILVVSGDGQSVPAGGVSSPLGAKVVDANGNPVGYVTVHFEITTVEGPGATFTGTGGQSENVVTQADGIAYSSPLQVDNTTGAITVSANETYFGFATSFTLNVFSNTPPTPGAPASIIAVSGDGQSVPAGGTSGSLGAQVLDANGMPVPNVTVHFVIYGGEGSYAYFTGTEDWTEDAVTQADGIAYTSPLQVSQYTGTFDIQASESISGAWVYFTMNVEPPAPLPVDSLSIVSGDGQSICFEFTTFAPLGVVALDANSSPISGADVTFTAPAGDPGATFDNTGMDTIGVTTDMYGVAYSGTLTGHGAGPYTVTVTSGSASTSFTLDNSVCGMPA